MFSRAKETVFSAMRPYLAKGVEPELALFMLATLPVITVALRAADEQSRRPMEAPRPLDYRPPRVVRYPKSPAKADQKLIAKDRAQYATAAVTAPGDAAADVMDSVDEANLTGDVKAAVAVEDGEEKLRAELKRLRRELASATMLAGKVEALERANARLMKQVAELSMPPSPEEIQRLAEKEAERCDSFEAFFFFFGGGGGRILEKKYCIRRGVRLMGHGRWLSLVLDRSIRGLL